MKPSEFAEAYARPRPFVTVEQSYQRGVTFDKRMGDNLLWLMELEADADWSSLPAEQQLLNNRLQNEYAEIVRSAGASRTLMATAPEEVFTPQSTEKDMTEIMRLYQQLQYEAFAVSWQEMAFGLDFSDSERKSGLRMGQLVLAAHSVRLSVFRRKLASIEEDYAYFSDSMEVARRGMDGIMQELDTGIVAMEIVKADPEMMIVNAPGRFERMSSRYAVDLIAYHRIVDNVIGAQTKANLEHSNSTQYDQERVMMIHGADDFKGAIRTRAFPGTTRERIVAWPGIIAAELNASLKLHGKQADLRTGYDRAAVLRSRHDANESLRLPNGSKNKLRGTLQHATKVVGDRLYERLEAERPRRQKADRSSNGQGRRSKQSKRR